MAKKHQVILLLGSNIQDRKDYLSRARTLIEKEIGTIEKKSAIYESEPWGFQAEVFFLNQVLFVSGELSPAETLRKTQQIEVDLGRIQKSNGTYSSRAIDIDILFFDQLIIEDPDLIIPHPQLHKRRFTLIPLAEIIPKWIHPVFQKNCEQLLEMCIDEGNVWRLKNEGDNDKV